MFAQAFDSGLEAAFSPKRAQVPEQSHPDDLSDAEISPSRPGISLNCMAAQRSRRVVDPESREREREREREHFPEVKSSRANHPRNSLVFFGCL
jgi:hypothetical protein